MRRARVSLLSFLPSSLYIFFRIVKSEISVKSVPLPVICTALVEVISLCSIKHIKGLRYRTTKARMDQPWISERSTNRLLVFNWFPFFLQSLSLFLSLSLSLSLFLSLFSKTNVLQLQSIIRRSFCNFVIKEYGIATYISSL